MSQDVTQITTHAALALARLVEQYKGKPLFSALLNCITPQVQQIEDMLFSVRDGLQLANAVGAQLDVIGRIVGQAREASNDAEYRLRIAARIRANLSTGSTESILSVFSLLLPPPDHTLKITPHYPAAFVLDLFGETDPALTPLYARFLADSKAAGVGGIGILTVVPDEETFIFDDAASPVPASDLGFGDATDSSVGGHLGGVF